MNTVRNDFVEHSRQYRKKWQAPVPNMPERYSRVNHDELYKFQASKLLPSGMIRPDDMESIPSGAESESDDSFYEFTTDENPKKPLRQGQREEEEAFRRGRVCSVGYACVTVPSYFEPGAHLPAPTNVLASRKAASNAASNNDTDRSHTALFD